MNNLKLAISIFIVSLIIISCEPPVIFESAYPPNDTDLTEFPSIYQGIYVFGNDSSQVEITSQRIILTEDHIFTIPMKDLEQRKVCRIEGDKIYIDDIDGCYPIRFINDSIVEGRITEVDTLFEMGLHSIARDYNGQVILSKEMKPNEWALHVLEMDYDFNIMYKAITNESDIDAIKKITITEDITKPQDKEARYSIKPSMIEFDELLNNKDIFIENEFLIRLNVDELIPWIF